MKVIFLDVDGVLIAFGPQASSIGSFDPDCMSALKEIVEKTGAKIVISSSWRESKVDLALLMHKLNEIGISEDDVIDMTPELHSINGEMWDDDKGKFVGGDGWTGGRGHEIETWLLANLTNVDKFVILDDDPTAKQRKDWQHGMFVNTDFNTGLSSEEADKTIKFLKG